MNKQYRVLHIFSGYGGGVSSLILNLVENKTEDFVFDMVSFSYRGGDTFVERVEKMGSHCYTMPRPRLEGYKKLTAYLDTLLVENQYDAIHCHIAGWMALPFEKAARKNGISTFILHAHTTMYDSKLDRIPIIHKIDRWLNYKNATNYMTCSDMAAEYIYGSKYLVKRPAILIPNGVKKSDFATEITAKEILAYKIEFGIPENTKIVLHVGRFNEQKNHRFLVDIIDAATKNDLNYIFLLVGDGVLLQEIKDKVEKQQLTRNVRFLNRRLDVSKLMQYADCMVLPSFYEGLPTVAIECQASGTPILLASTITKQCDMNLGLTRFLPIDSVTPWVNSLTECIGKRKVLKDSIDQIEENGFTAKAAGLRYCGYLREYITNNRK